MPLILTLGAEVKSPIVAALAIVAACPAIAIDIGAARKKPIVASFSSKFSIYDLERCLIELDTAVAPIVYRQPDRPDEELVVYAERGTIFSLLELAASAGSTAITMRSIRGIGGTRIAHEAQSCAAGQNDAGRQPQ